MKNALSLTLFLLIWKCIVVAQVSQFPQVYYNGQGAGGSNLNIRANANSSETAITTLSISSRIGAESIVTNSSDHFMNFIKVCLPSTSSTNNAPNYGYMPCSDYYAQLNETNQYAIVSTTSTPLGVRTSSSGTTYVTIAGAKAYYGKNSILALTGESTADWHKIFLPNNCSQTTGWVSSKYLTIPVTESYYIVGGRISDNASEVLYLGNVNQASIKIGDLGSTYSSEGYYEYKVPINKAVKISCTHPDFNTSTPPQYSITVEGHDYSRQFVLSNTICNPVAISNQPQNQTATVGGTATFSVSASGSSPYTYQWFKNDSQIAGKTSSTFTTPTLALSDNGNSYKCFLTNCDGSNTVTSDIATLTVNKAEGSISGSIVAPVIYDLTGGIKNNTVTSTIKLFLTGSQSAISSQTNSSGSFSFSGLTETSYDIEASQTINGILYKTKETKISLNTSNIILKLSSQIIEQITQYNKDLENLSCYLNDLSLTVKIKSYDLYNSSSYIKQKRSIIDSDDADIETLARLAMSERMLVKYYNQAKTMGQEFVFGTDELTKTICNIIEMFSCNKNSNWFKSFMNESLIDILITSLEYPINNSNIPYKNTYIGYLGALKDALKSKGENVDISLGSVYNQVRPFTQNWSLNILLHDTYVERTKQLPDLVTTKAQNWTTQGNIDNTIKSNLDLLQKSEILTATAQGMADGLINNPSWVEWLNNFSSTASSALCGKEKFSSLLALGLGVVKVGLLGGSIYKSVQRTNQLVDEVSRTSSNSFITTRSSNAFNEFNLTIHGNRVGASINAITNFESEYLNTINEISLGNYSNLKNRVDNLIAYNKQVDGTISEEVNGIKASIPFSTITDSVYFEDLKNTLFGNPYTRFAHILSIAYLAENPSETGLRDSILAYSDGIISSNTLMLAEIDRMADSIIGISSPAYLTLKSSSIPISLQVGTVRTQNLSIKNYGSTNAKDVSIRISNDGSFLFAPDSIYIGDLGVGEEKTLIFNIIAPFKADTVSYYNISILSESALTRPIGGAIKSVKQSTGINKINAKNSSMLENYPNPFNESTTVKYSVTKKGIVTIKIFDMNGKFLQTILNEVKDVGVFELNFESKNLKSGTYFYQVQVGDHKDAEKMLIIK